MENKILFEIKVGKEYRNTECKQLYNKNMGIDVKMQNMNTQIYGTFGPSCKSQEILEEMIKAGMTGMRLNLSHTTLEKSKEYIDNYRNVAKKCEVMPQILIDMQGPELRVGDMKELSLEVGEVVLLKESELDREVKEDNNTWKGVDEIQSMPKEIPVPSAVLSVIKIGNEVLLDDGKIRIRIEEVNSYDAKAKVLIGGNLKPHKSIKIVDVNVIMPVLTPHDIANIRLAKEFGVTALMQPFVYSGEDLEQVKEILKEERAEEIQVLAKVENRIGAANLENILPKADMIIIARGDLGNDMPLWELPVIQKQIEEACKNHGKPYMVVTQMLASMEQNPVPTRAEVSDIFHAVYHGAGAIMVTGETAVGKHPVEVIRYLANTAKEAEMYRAMENEKAGIN